MKGTLEGVFRMTGFVSWPLPKSLDFCPAGAHPLTQ
jgi:hypothetical protein